MTDNLLVITTNAGHHKKDILLYLHVQLLGEKKGPWSPGKSVRGCNDKAALSELLCLTMLVLSPYVAWEGGQTRHNVAPSLTL